MLNDNVLKTFRCACKNGGKCRYLMKKSIRRSVVAFLRAYHEDGNDDLKAILAHPNIAPTKLDPVSYRET